MPAIATPIDSYSKGPETFPEGRVCARPKCKHALSIYNPGPLCNACEGPVVDPVVLGMALAEILARDELAELMQESPDG